jgi:hypothetical protein
MSVEYLAGRLDQAGDSTYPLTVTRRSPKSPGPMPWRLAVVTSSAR